MYINIHYTNIQTYYTVIDINPIVTPNHLWDPPATPTFEADAMGSDCYGPKKWITSTAVAGGDVATPVSTRSVFCIKTCIKAIKKGWGEFGMLSIDAIRC